MSPGRPGVVFILVLLYNLIDKYFLCTMDEDLIKFAQAEATASDLQMNALLLEQATDPDIADVANDIFARIRAVGDDQVLDDPRYDELMRTDYEFRIPQLQAVSAAAGADVRNILRLADKRVYQYLYEEERAQIQQEDRRSPDLRFTRELPDGLGKFIRHGFRFIRDEGLGAIFTPMGRRNSRSPLDIGSPEFQLLQRRVARRLARFDPILIPADRDLVALELARLTPQRLLFSLPELNAWSTTNLVAPGSTVRARLEEMMGSSNMTHESIVPLLAYLRGNPAGVVALQDLYTEVQGGDEESTRIALYGPTGRPGDPDGLKAVFESEKRRHDACDAAFKAEIERHDLARKNHERDKTERIGTFDEAATKLSTVQKDLTELLALMGPTGKISSINAEIAALPVMPTPAPVPPTPAAPAPTPGSPVAVTVNLPAPPTPQIIDPSLHRRADLEKEKRQLTDRQSELSRSVIRRYQEYAAEFAREIVADPVLFDNLLISGLDASTITSVNDTHLESLTCTIATLRARTKPAMADLRLELDTRDEARRQIELRKTAWEAYKEEPYQDRTVPPPADCQPTGFTLDPPHARLRDLRAHSLDSLKERHDEAEVAYKEVLKKVSSSPFKKAPLSPETLLYELQLRDPSLSALLSPEKETRALTRTMILMHETKSRVNEGATQRRADHLHDGGRLLSGAIDMAKGGIYRPFDEIQRDAFLRDERLKGVEGLTLTSSVEDILGKVRSEDLTEEQLQLYIYQLELLAQNRLTAAKLNHDEDARALLHNCRVAYWTIKARTILTDIGERSDPMDKASELRAKILDAAKSPEALPLDLEISRVAENRRRIEQAVAKAESEEDPEGPLHKKAEAVTKYGRFTVLVLGARGIKNALFRFGRYIDSKRPPKLPPPQ